MIRVERSAELHPRHGIFAWHCAHDGQVLEGRSRQPLLDACRAIKRMGALTDEQQIGLYREGRQKPDMICSLGWGADHTVSEGEKHGPHFVKWRPFNGWE